VILEIYEEDAPTRVLKEYMSNSVRVYLTNERMTLVKF
jgi:hypothetical protein